MAFGALRYLYVGSKDPHRDAAWYVQGGARKLWEFDAFGAKVAGLEVGDGPQVLLADHRPVGSVIPIWEVADLKASVKGLLAKGWEAGEPFEVPTGPCRMFEDPSGNELCLIQVTRPEWPGAPS